MFDHRGRAAVAVAVTLAFGASCSGIPGRSNAAARPRVQPLSHAAFQAQLTAASNLLGDALDRVARAGTPDVLEAALAAAASVSPHAANVLAEGLAPTEIYDSTGRFVQHMRLLAEELQSLADRAEGFQLCAGPSAMAALSALDHAQKLRAAALDVASHGYQVRDLIPATTPVPDRHAANNTVLLDAADRGDGPDLTIDNSTDQDSQVTVLLGGSPRLAIYVTAHATATVTGIPNGSYMIDFTQGEDWDPTLKVFTRTCSFISFDKPLVYDGTTTWTVGLKPEANGSPSHRVPPMNYPKI